MRFLAAVLLALVLSGCSIAINGQHSTDGGSSRIHTSTATQGQASFGSARVGASFGKAVPTGAPGGQASLSSGASAALILGLVIADLVHYLSTPAQPVHGAPLSAYSIADTCSCYGYKGPAQQ